MPRTHSRGSKFDPFDSVPNLMHLLQNHLCMRIITLVSIKPRNVSRLATELNVGQSGVSHALAALSDCGLVVSERIKKNVIYGVNPALELHAHDGKLKATLHCKNGDLLHFVSTPGGDP
jgi:DNA-binding transcriptional ArsR family regulator